jgi:hypothetical protein
MTDTEKNKHSSKKKIKKLIEEGTSNDDAIRCYLTSEKIKTYLECIETIVYFTLKGKTTSEVYHLRTAEDILLNEFNRKIKINKSIKTADGSSFDPSIFDNKPSYNFPGYL